MTERLWQVPAPFCLMCAEKNVAILTGRLNRQQQAVALLDGDAADDVLNEGFAGAAAVEAAAGTVQIIEVAVAEGDRAGAGILDVAFEPEVLDNDGGRALDA